VDSADLANLIRWRVGLVLHALRDVGYMNVSHYSHDYSAYNQSLLCIQCVDYYLLVQGIRILVSHD
jgi:hypothetical protein